MSDTYHPGPGKWENYFAWLPVNLTPDYIPTLAWGRVRRRRVTYPNGSWEWQYSKRTISSSS